MLPFPSPKTVCLTVNRRCNLNCGWCYVDKTAQQMADMSFEVACKLVDISIEAGARNLLLFGGEPTV